MLCCHPNTYCPCAQKPAELSESPPGPVSSSTAPRQHGQGRSRPSSRYTRARPLSEVGSPTQPLSQGPGALCRVPAASFPPRRAPAALGAQTQLEQQNATRPSQLLRCRQPAQRIVAEESRRQQAKASTLCFAAVPNSLLSPSGFSSIPAFPDGAHSHFPNARLGVSPRPLLFAARRLPHPPSIAAGPRLRAASSGARVGAAWPGASEEPRAPQGWSTKHHSLLPPSLTYTHLSALSSSQTSTQLARTPGERR